MEASICTDVQKFLHLSDMVSFLNSFRVNDSLCDVTITLRNRTYRAHKVVLASASAYFRVMFTSGYSESTMAEVPLEETPDLDGESFATLLDFMYTGELRLSLETMPQVLACASYLQIEHATKACVDFINKAANENELSFAEFIKISSMTLLYDIDCLKETASGYFAKQFSDVCKTEAFVQHMTYQNISDLLDRTDLLVSSENEVFEAVILWLKHNWSERKIYSIHLLGKVRLGLLPLEKIIREFENQLNEIPECEELYVDILKYYASGKTKFVSKVLAEKQEDIVTPRRVVKALVAIGLRSFVFNEDNQKIDNIAIVFDAQSHNVEVANGELYCAGGHYGTELYKYDNKAEDRWPWISLPAMNRARANFAFVHDRGYLYVIGGTSYSWYRFTGTLKNKTCATYSVERYHLASGKWQKLAPVFPSSVAPNIYFSKSVAKYKKRLFVTGCSKSTDSKIGYRFDHYVMMFNPYLNKWYSLCSQSLGKNVHTFHILNRNETLYLIAPPTVYKCECDVGSNSKQSQPSFTIGDIVDRKCIPQKLNAFSIDGDVYIIVSGYIYKTSIVVTDDQINDVDLSAYSAFGVDPGRYAVTNFSFDRKLNKSNQRM